MKLELLHQMEKCSKAIVVQSNLSIVQAVAQGATTSLDP
jgi:hypothetical protein